ncbi:MAG: 5-formyltetrahydrofolate cyclo-ligase [Pseudomonadota bacterium]
MAASTLSFFFMTIAEKQQLRAHLKGLRRSVGEARDRSSRLAAWRLLSLVPVDQSPIVALFWSLADEIDTSPIRSLLETLDLDLALPRMTGREMPLVFHQWRSGDTLISGPMGVQEPASSSNAVAPDVIIVPLLGFDCDGYRLGYGGGFYDRTLAGLRQSGLNPLSIGLAFDCQRVDKIPREPQDEPLEFIVTEAQIYCCGSQET